MTGGIKEEVNYGYIYSAGSWLEDLLKLTPKFFFFFVCVTILDKNSPEFMNMSSVHTGVSMLTAAVVFAIGTFATIEVGGVI